MPYPVYSYSFLVAEGITPASGLILSPPVPTGQLGVLKWITAMGTSGGEDTAFLLLEDGSGNHVNLRKFNQNANAGAYYSESLEYRVVLPQGFRVGLQVTAGTVDATFGGYLFTS